MADTIFSKIISGTIPCHKIYEDDKTLAFLDIHPVRSGHTLIIPKIAVEYVWDLPEEYYFALMITAKKVALRLKDVLGAPYIGEKIVGVDVAHAHVHLIPFSTVEEFNGFQETSSVDDSLLNAMAKKLAF